MRPATIRARAWTPKPQTDSARGRGQKRAAGRRRARACLLWETRREACPPAPLPAPLFLPARILRKARPGQPPCPPPQEAEASRKTAGTAQRPRPGRAPQPDGLAALPPPRLPPPRLPPCHRPALWPPPRALPPFFPAPRFSGALAAPAAGRRVHATGPARGAVGKPQPPCPISRPDFKAMPPQGVAPIRRRPGRARAARFPAGMRQVSVRFSGSCQPVFTLFPACPFRRQVPSSAFAASRRRALRSGECAPG